MRNCQPLRLAEQLFTSCDPFYDSRFYPRRKGCSRSYFDRPWHSHSHCGNGCRQNYSLAEAGSKRRGQNSYSPLIATKTILLGVASGPALIVAAAEATGGITIGGPWVLAAMGGAGTVIAVLFKLLIASKDKELQTVIAQTEDEKKELEGLKKSYQEIATEALKSATEAANYYREKEGKPPVALLAPVVSEAHSPSTARQRENALIATMRANMAAVKLATGQLPRPEPEHGSG